jgi:hypothetical protein
MKGARAAFLAGLLLLGATAIGGGAADAASPTPSSVQIRKVDTSGYPTVAVTVSVSGGILPTDIGITENGSPSDVITVRPLLEVGKGIDVVLALDTSQSVAGAPLQQAVAAAQLFVNSLPSGV